MGPVTAIPTAARQARFSLMPAALTLLAVLAMLIVTSARARLR